jgi:hypothetical protein
VVDGRVGGVVEGGGEVEGVVDWEAGGAGARVVAGEVDVGAAGAGGAAGAEGGGRGCGVLAVWRALLALTGLISSWVVGTALAM